ncbi:MAG: hypothetical protein L0177_04985 [Chloroflexi bacterium]|nr:hypothetical protein [Chloroflexota bacterium]
MTMQAAQWLGGILIAAGALALAGYGLYFYFDAVIGSPDVPLAVKAASPAIGAGLLTLLVVVIVQRVQSKRRETFKETDY